MPSARVLIVEDELPLAEAMCARLISEGLSVAHCRCAEDALVHVKRHTWDLLILDLMLPGISGFELLALVLQSPVAPRVLMVTARDSVQDRVRGLNAGADDYLIKPFAMTELIARIQALLRRSNAVLLSSPMTLGPLRLDPVTRQAIVGPNLISLTAREFDLLAFLLRQSPKVVARDSIAREVWHVRQRATPIDNVIDVHVARLRRKLETAGAPRLIHTARGLGFCAAMDSP